MTLYDRLLPEIKEQIEEQKDISPETMYHLIESLQTEDWCVNLKWRALKTLNDYFKIDLSQIPLIFKK